METPLAVVSVDGIDRDRFSRIQAAAAQQLGEPLAGDTGTINHSGVKVDYAYAGSTLTLNVMAVPHFLGHPVISATAVQLRLLNWVYSVT